MKGKFYTDISSLVQKLTISGYVERIIENLHDILPISMSQPDLVNRNGRSHFEWDFTSECGTQAAGRKTGDSALRSCPGMCGSGIFCKPGRNIRPGCHCPASRGIQGV
jgi:hypothetical protein